MFTVRVHPSQINDRINAEANSPELIENFDLIQSSGFEIKNLGKLVDAPINNSIRNVTEEFQNLNGTIPMFRPADMNGFWLDSDTAPKISRAFEEKHRKARVYPGDIVLAAAGTVGQAARVPPHVEFGNINGSCARISPSPGLDGYLLAYLNSRIGYLALMRLVVGSVQKHLNLEDLPGLLVPLPNKTVQTYIGDKVRQAERLRERSTELEKSIKKHFDFLTSDLQPKRKSWRIISKKVESYRLNPSHYDSVVLSMLDDAEDRVDLVRLGSLFGMNGMSGGATPEGAEYPEEGIFFVRVQNVKPLRLNLLDSVYLSSDQDEELRRSRCDAGDIILTITGYPGVAAIVTEEDLPININQHSVRFDIREGWEAEYIVAALNTNFLKMQVNRFAIGATRDALDYPSVSNLLIPVLPVETRQKIAQDVIAANLATRASERLVTAAKFLVEALIEGNITELELQEAQEALQQGDTTLDRQILSRLTRKGIPGRGEKTEEPPLFPDLDALYRVLSDDDDTDEDSDWDSTPESRQRWQTPIQFSRCAAEASTPYSQDATVTLLDEEGD